MTSSDNPINSFLLGLAVELTVKLFELGAGRLKAAAFGESEEVALKRVYQAALATALDRTAGNLDKEDQYLVGDVLMAFVKSDDTADRLLDLAILKERPPLDRLRAEFDRLDFDTDTLPVDFDALLGALAAALEVEIREEASRADSPLANRFMVRGLSALLEEYRLAPQETRAAIREELATFLSSLAGVGSQSLKVDAITDLRGVAIGWQNSVTYQQYGLTFDDWLEAVRVLNPEVYARLSKESPVQVCSGVQPLSQPMQRLLDVIRGGQDVLCLDETQAKTLPTKEPGDLTAQRLQRVVEWAQPRYKLDRHFVRLTMLVQGAEGWREEASRQFQDLNEVLAEYGDGHPAFVLLGDPGSGKSTLLRRLQMDLCLLDLRGEDAERVTFYAELNSYRAEKKDGKYSPSPNEWLVQTWRSACPSLPDLDGLLKAGRLFLLLDGLNEMDHAGDYDERVEAWREFAVEAAKSGSRLLFSCRDLNYSASLSSEGLPVPHIRIQPMTDPQVQEFLDLYLPEDSQRVWSELKGSKQLALFRTPYFLKLLVEQVQATGEIPRGRSSLFTGFVRRTLVRETHFRKNRLLEPGILLSQFDRTKLNTEQWRSAFDLPMDGALVPQLESLAFRMQAGRDGGGEGLVSMPVSAARELVDLTCADDLFQAGVDLNVLDIDLAKERPELKYFHQLLQEYFAARQFARAPELERLRVEWRSDRAPESLAEALSRLGDGDPLPGLPATGWEESGVLAAAMVRDAECYVRALMEVNLPLAARCAANPEAGVSEALQREVAQALAARVQDPAADLRARIEAGLALGGELDPRFEAGRGAHGGYLLPRLVDIPAGEYPIGDDGSPYAQEKPAHTVRLEAFQIGVFPVTNAEYALFMDAGGYENEAWWETPAARAWRRGEGSVEGGKKQWRDNRKVLQGWSEEHIQGLVRQNRVTSKEAEDWITIRNWSDERFEQQLEEWYPEGKVYRQPEFWEDSRFASPAQPVVGVCWYEARAYCRWLAASTGLPFRLPSEVEREAAARGREGRTYAYGNAFDASVCNTFETHLRRTAPVGIFPGGETPEGAQDMTGNVWDWTCSLYDTERFGYPYRSADGREDAEAEGTRVLRGGSWYYYQYGARCAARFRSPPDGRGRDDGFRLARSCL
jgi:formylglycine-generating enzyme required for sulfatase activity